MKDTVVPAILQSFEGPLQLKSITSALNQLVFGSEKCLKITKKYISELLTQFRGLKQAPAGYL